MKKLFIITALATAVILNAQASEPVKENDLYLKINTVFLPLGFLNTALEYQISDKITLQGEVFISPWKSYMGKYAQMYMAGVDVRYYFNEAFKHLYVGANITGARYIMQKYNYWSDLPYQYQEGSPIYVISDLYQDGYSIFAGAVVGYQWHINEKWNLDLYVGAGSAQSFYRGFHKELGVRYDVDPSRDLNKSGELVPYRGGLMLSYKL